jgi:hypothetical protein
MKFLIHLYGSFGKQSFKSPKETFDFLVIASEVGHYNLLVLWVT